MELYFRPRSERRLPVPSNSEAKRINAERHNAAIDAKGYGVHGPSLVAGPFQGNRAQKRAALFSKGGKKTSRSRPVKQRGNPDRGGRGLSKIEALVLRSFTR